MHRLNPHHPLNEDEAARVRARDPHELVDDDAATKSFWLARGMPDFAWTATTACGGAPDAQ